MFADYVDMKPARVKGAEAAPLAAMAKAAGATVHLLDKEPS